jgi:hypothetical protein
MRQFRIMGSVVITKNQRAIRTLVMVDVNHSLNFYANANKFSKM